MIIYLLINNYQESFKPISQNIKVDDFKSDENKLIYKTIIDSNVNSNEEILQIISNIESQEIQSHVSEILVSDYGIKSVKKGIEDIVNIYEKEHLNERKIQIIKELEKKHTNEELESLGQELNEIIVKLTKIK